MEFEDGTDYRSISGPARPSDFEPTSLIVDELAEEVDDLFDMGAVGGESLADYLKRRNIELDRALREHPTNVQAWIQFVEFQDEVSLSGFGSGSGMRKSLSKSERTSTCEIKLAILERALTVKENVGSEILLLAYLSAMAEVESPQVVLAKWTSTVRHLSFLSCGSL